MANVSSPLGVTGEQEQLRLLAGDNAALKVEISRLVAEITKLNGQAVDLTTKIAELEISRLELTGRANLAEGALEASKAHIATLTATLTRALDLERQQVELERTRDRVSALEDQARAQLTRLMHPVTTTAPTAPLPAHHAN